MNLNNAKPKTSNKKILDSSFLGVCWKFLDTIKRLKMKKKIGLENFQIPKGKSYWKFVILLRFHFYYDSGIIILTFSLSFLQFILLYNFIPFPIPFCTGTRRSWNTTWYSFNFRLIAFHFENQTLVFNLHLIQNSFRLFPFEWFFKFLFPVSNFRLSKLKIIILTFLLF